MATASVSYNPGTPTKPYRLGDITWAVPSFREPGITYIVCMTGLTCNCRAFTHGKRRGLPCKHVELAAAEEQAQFEARKEAAITDQQLRDIFA